MRAWRFYAFGDMRLDEVPRPRAEPGWVVCKVRVVQASITDVQRALGVATIRSDHLRRILAERAPVSLLGHEFCGEVVEVGEGVSEFHVGDLVSTPAHVPCGRCAYCRMGKDGWCRAQTHFGMDFPGAFAECAALPAAGLVRVPSGLDPSEIACLQPLSSAVGAVRDAGIRPGERVAILGQGVMGIYCLQVARVCGAGACYTADVKEEALSLSRRFGADVAIDARREDPVGRVRELTGGLGVDVAFECAGGNPDQGLAGHTTFHQATRMVRIGGRVVQVAGLVGEVKVDPVFFRGAGIRWVFPEGHGRETMMLAAQWLASGRLDLKPLITHRVHGIEKLPEAMEITHHKEKYKAMGPCQVVVG